MLGAIAGDICGCPWEGGQCAQDDFELFTHGASITDDTVCTIAIADALMHAGDARAVVKSLRRWCRRYPGLGYGSAFNHWVYSGKGPYNSWGNGGAMRVSPCGWLAGSLEEAEALAEMTASVTHDHPEGLRGARAIAGATWLARQGMTGEHLRLSLAARYGYKLDVTLTELIERNEYTTEARQTVPVALMCATHATSWEHAIELAARIGGDTDTIACMAGGIAEGRFGLSSSVVNSARQYLTADMVEVVDAFYAHIGRSPVAERQPDNPQTIAATPPGVIGFLLSRLRAIVN
jgi:ADP-ribosylglycohydrolase